MVTSWPNQDEAYAWILESVDKDVSFEQLADPGRLGVVDSRIAVSLYQLIREATSYHAELDRRVKDRLLDRRKAALDGSGKKSMLRGRQMLRIIWEYYKTAKSSAVDDYATLDCLVLIDGQEEAFIHKWDENMRELGFTPEARSSNTMGKKYEEQHAHE